MIFTAVTFCSFAALLIVIMHIFRHKSSKLIVMIKMSIAPIAIIGTSIAYILINNTAIGIALLLIALFSSIFIHEGYIHYLLMKKGYPIPKEEKWFYLSVKDVKGLPNMAPGFKKQAKKILINKIYS